MTVTIQHDRPDTAVVRDAAGLSELIRAGRSSDAVARADEILPHLADPVETVRVLLTKLAALLNLGRMTECPRAIDQADAALRALPAGHPEPAMVGEFHALAASVAHHQGSLERCVTHLVRGARALEEAGPAEPGAARAWLDLAVTYSWVGFHRHAVAAQQRAMEISRAAGMDPVFVTHPEIRVRHALALDHQGDTEACLRALGEITRTLGPDDVTGFELPYLGYALARYAALGGRGGIDARPLLRTDLEPYQENGELRRLGEACLAIAEHRPTVALALLDGASAVASRLGAAEVPRLRALAHTALGDHVAAHADDRVVAGMLARTTTRLYDLFVDGVTARLDHDELRRSVTRYADEAHTDSLTGLPNRRHLERYVAELARHGTYGTIGVADLDGFKSVNTVHGHLSGDQVLQHVAAILTRALRGGDFLARFGGDEFVVVLPGTPLAEAQEVGSRLAAAVAGYDWNTLVPGTPVTLTMGLAELNSRTSLTAAFRAADLVMLQAKAG
ncbi:GGDEF domain-containing protein [Longispora sp. K20-0274]|uniref:diguanylate cyclase domain-containing protein n=1 Tax=Longispora sp. K20-0274 TaxID=3088255 RepID=UPI00399A6DC0